MITKTPWIINMITLSINDMTMFPTYLSIFLHSLIHIWKKKVENLTCFEEEEEEKEKDKWGLEKNK